MKRNNHHAPAGPQHFETVGKKSFQVVELLVHGNAQGLKHLGSWMVVAPPAADCSLDQTRQLVRGIDGSLFALSRYLFGDPPRARLLAIGAVYPGQLFPRRCVDEAISVERLPAIHAHIQPPAQAKTKSSLRRIDLP